MIAGTKHAVSKMTGAFDGYGDGGEGVWGAVEIALRRCGLSSRRYLRACLRMMPEPLPTCGRCSASLIRGAGNHRVILCYHQRPLRLIGQAPHQISPPRFAAWPKLGVNVCARHHASLVQLIQGRATCGELGDHSHRNPPPTDQWRHRLDSAIAAVRLRWRVLAGRSWFDISMLAHC